MRAHGGRKVLRKNIKTTAEKYTVIGLRSVFKSLVGP